jgi:HSP90 family molecular chaperone
MDVKKLLASVGEDEQVQVNQRALIDKVLARYSGEFTVYRELLQNANDASATTVEIHLYPTSTQDHGSPETAKGEWPENLKKQEIGRIMVRNDGIEFNDDDWNRLKKIAEGNPNEDKIGAFGVGFYSL